MKNNYGIKFNDIVTISYTAKTENGEIVLSSHSEGPLTFRVGHFPLIKGLNKAILGMNIGESKKCIFSPEEAFGVIDKLLICKIPLSDLPNGLKEGESVSDKSTRTYFKILKIDSVDNEVLLDANHILAGQILTFSMTVLGKMEESSSLLIQDKVESKFRKNRNRSSKMRMLEAVI